MAISGSQLVTSFPQVGHKSVTSTSCYDSQVGIVTQKWRTLWLVNIMMPATNGSVFSSQLGFVLHIGCAYVCTLHINGAGLLYAY